MTTEKNKPSRERRSKSGTKVRGGRFWEEYLSVLQHRQTRYQTFDKMRRSDYQIARMLRTLKAPILSGNFEYKPIDPNDSEQKRQTLFKNRLFKKHCVDKWQNTLYQILSYLDFGFIVTEPYAHVVKDPDLGKVITMRSLGLLRQSTIAEWDIKDSVIKRIRQISSESVEREGYQDKWISGKRLHCLTNQKEGDNFEGISLLRMVYGNYVRKDLYLRLDMIGIERMAVGTPVMYMPDSKISGDDTTDLSNMEALLEAYVASEKQFLILPKSLKGNKDEPPGFVIQEGRYDSSAVQSAIQREDTKIMDSVLASFLDIGVYKSGGNSQNEGQMEMFLNSLLSVAEMVAEFRDDIAHAYYVLNFGEPKVRIDTSITGITKNDAKQIMEILRGYAQVDIIRPDERLEKEIRADLKLPEKDEATERQIVAQPDKNTERTPEGEETPQSNPEKAKTDE